MAVATLPAWSHCSWLNFWGSGPAPSASQTPLCSDPVHYSTTTSVISHCFNHGFGGADWGTAAAAVTCCFWVRCRATGEGLCCCSCCLPSGSSGWNWLASGRVCFSALPALVAKNCSGWMRRPLLSAISCSNNSCRLQVCLRSWPEMCLGYLLPPLHLLGHRLDTRFQDWEWAWTEQAPYWSVDRKCCRSGLGPSWSKIVWNFYHHGDAFLKQSISKNHPGCVEMACSGRSCCNDCVRRKTGRNCDS